MTVAGAVVLSADGVPWQIDYEVRCDEHWRTRAVSVRAHAGLDERALALDVDERGRWRLNEEERSDLQGCVDVDLGFSPSTNTLPIRRLHLDIGQGATIDAAWVEFPRLVVHRVPQRYTRIGELRYRYDNLPTGFTADVDVDERGLVVAYPPGWERIVGPTTRAPLFSDSSSPELSGAPPFYQDLVGSWDVEVIDSSDDGTRETRLGEWHFGWALEGRAVLDVFIVPDRAHRPTALTAGRTNRYGTTTRFFDQARRAWRIVWINPVSGAVNSLIARREGQAIVQEGTDDDGTLMRWTFVEMARDRFRWLGEESRDAGATWRTRAEFSGRRRSFAPLW